MPAEGANSACALGHWARTTKESAGPSAAASHPVRKTSATAARWTYPRGTVPMNNEPAAKALSVLGAEIAASILGTPVFLRPEQVERGSGHPAQA